MKTFAQNGYSFNYIEQGQGPPLVLVHGSASDLRTWWVQEDRLARHLHTIAYSRRYHWPNEPIAADVDYGMDRQVEDLRAILRSLKVAPAHLVGHSYGAFLCLLAVLREPGLARTLVLAEPPAITLFVSSVPKPAEILKLLFTRPRTAAVSGRRRMRSVRPIISPWRATMIVKGPLTSSPE